MAVFTMTNHLMRAPSYSCTVCVSPHAPRLTPRGLRLPPQIAAGVIPRELGLDAGGRLSGAALAVEQVGSVVGEVSELSCVGG